LSKAMITGGSGFLGKALGRYLALRGYEAIPFDSGYPAESSQEHRRGSILNPDDLDAAIVGMDVVFHLAGCLGTTELLSRNQEAIDVNIKGTVNVLDACVRHGVQTVFYPTKPNDWLNTYSITKKAGEEFAQLYAQTRGLDVRILRWLNAYGPGQKLYPIRKAVPVMILQALHGLDVEIWGTGDQPVDLIHTEDLARNTVQYTLADNIDSTVRDAGNTVRMTVNEMAALILRLTGSKSHVIRRPIRAGEDQNKPVQLLPGASAVDLLGLAADTRPIEQGMAETIEYYAKLPPGRLQSALAFYYGQRVPAQRAA